MNEITEFSNILDDMTCNSHSYISYEDIQKISSYIHTTHSTIFDLEKYIKLAFGPTHRYLKPCYKYLIYLTLTHKKLTLSTTEKEKMVEYYRNHMDTYTENYEEIAFDIAKKLGFHHFSF